MCDNDYGNDYTASIDVSSDAVAINWSTRGAFFTGDFLMALYLPILIRAVISVALAISVMMLVVSSALSKQ